MAVAGAVRYAIQVKSSGLDIIVAKDMTVEVITLQWGPWR